MQSPKVMESIDGYLYWTCSKYDTVYKKVNTNILCRFVQLIQSNSINYYFTSWTAYGNLFMIDANTVHNYLMLI